MFRFFPLFLTILIFLTIQVLTLLFMQPTSFSRKKGWLLFLLGMAGCLLTPFFQNFLYGILDHLALSAFIHLFLSAFLISGFLEESVKLLILLLFFSRSSAKPHLFESWKAAFSLILGFCMVENLFYLIKTNSNIFSRFLLAVPLHWGAILIGSWLLVKAIRMEKPTKRHQWTFFAFLLPSLFHGIYNFLLLLGESRHNQSVNFIRLNNQNWFFLFCIIEIIMIYSVLFLIYRYEKKQEQTRSLP